MPQKILAVIDDLFFTVKINEAAKHAGLTAEFVRNEVDALARAKLQPSLIVIDLNCSAVEPIGLIAALKGGPETKDIHLVAFVSHVQVDLKQKAQAAGCDTVLARSAFSQSMSQIFQRYAATL